MNRLMDHFFVLLSRFPRTAAIVAVLLVGLFASQVRPPTYAGSITDQISIDNPQIRAAEEIAAARGYRQGVVGMFEVGVASIGETFASIASLETSLRSAGVDVSTRSVRDLKDQLFLLGLDVGDPLTELVSVVQQDDQLRSLVSKDGKLLAVVAYANAAAEPVVVERMRRQGLGDGLALVDVLAGSALEQDVALGLRQDLRLLIPGIVSVMLAALLLGFGHWHALVLPAFASAASSVVVFSLLAVANVSINLVTLLALPIVLIVALANSCHFLARSGTDRDLASDPAAIVAATLRRVGVPYLISCLTTSVALLSLWFNEIGPIRDLGIIAAAALSISFFLNLLFAPWALRWYLSSRRRASHRGRLFRRFSGALRRRRTIVCVLLLAAAGASVLTLPSIEVRSDARAFFPDNAPFTRAFNLFEQRFQAFAPLLVLVRESDDESPGASLGALRYAGEIRDLLRASEGVKSARIEPAAAGGGFIVDAAVADESAVAALLLELSALQSAKGAAYRIVYSSAQLVYESIDEQALASLTESLTMSLLVIFGVIVFLFRSARTLVAALVANGVPLLIVFGVVWLAGDPLNLVTAFVFLVALGVIVDDTIHILYRHHDGESLSGSSIEFSVVISTIMLCAGLLLCQISDFPTTRQFATYCALALMGAVASDLTLLPAMLSWRRQPIRRGSQPSARSSR